MFDASHLFERLDRTFGDGVELTVARNLFGFLSVHPEASHITLQLVRQLTPEAGAGKLDSAIVRTLQYLASKSVNALEMRFELIDGDSTPVLLTDEEVTVALQEQVNPVSGEIDLEITSKVAIFFCPTAVVLEQLSANESSPRGEI